MLTSRRALSPEVAQSTPALTGSGSEAAFLGSGMGLSTSGDNALLEVSISPE